MDSMQMQIDELVEQLSPASGSIGMMTRSDVQELVRKAATKGTLIGYVAGEKLTVTRFKNQIQEYQYEYHNLAQHCKDLEMEIMGMKK
jgi:hypothetical protein